MKALSYLRQGLSVLVYMKGCTVMLIFFGFLVFVLGVICLYDYNVESRSGRMFWTSLLFIGISVALVVVGSWKAGV